MKTVKLMTVAGMAGVLALGSTSSFAYSAICPDNGAGPLNGCGILGSGLTPGSYPYFDNVVAVDSKTKYDKDGFVKDFSIKAKEYKGSVDNLFVVDSTTSYLIQKFKFKLSADFLSETEAVGDLSMKGGIDVNDDGKISKDEKFTVTANLAGPVAQSTEGDLWGFNTSDIVCDGVVTTLVPGNCTPEEVVYLNLLEAIDTDHKKISTAGRAITSVPLPAAAWLFGSGLMGLLAVSRRRSQRT